MPVEKFKTPIGSFIEIEVFPDDSANIYYQTDEQEDRQLLANVQNFHKKIEGKQKEKF